MYATTELGDGDPETAHWGTVDDPACDEAEWTHCADTDILDFPALVCSESDLEADNLAVGVVVQLDMAPAEAAVRGCPSRCHDLSEAEAPTVRESRCRPAAFFPGIRGCLRGEPSRQETCLDDALGVEGPTAIERSHLVGDVVGDDSFEMLGLGSPLVDVDGDAAMHVCDVRLDGATTELTEFAEPDATL